MLVLETVKANTPISRANVAQLTGLNKGTVSSLVSELIEEDFIHESGPGESSGGRRPVMLLFNRRAGYTLSIDLGVGYILGLLTDLTGNIVLEERIYFQKKEFNAVLPKLIEFITKLHASAPTSTYGIIGIGIGVPGVVSKQGEVLLAPNLDWKRIQLKQVLEDSFSTPVIIENEANAGAYGEMKFGSGQTANHMIYASIGNGIGMGLILNGELYSGLHGFAGEIGHMTIDNDGIACRCGNVGCWERYASEQALIDKAIQLEIISPNELAPFDRLIEYASNGDHSTIHLFEEIAEYIGMGLTNCINIFNPELVIIGNQFIRAERWIRPVIEKYIQKHTIGFHQEELKIQFAEPKFHSSAVGMAAFTIEAFFHNQNQSNGHN